MIALLIILLVVQQQPAGGVKAGQRFTVLDAAGIATTAQDQNQRWSTGLCDCGKFGICHPHLCTVFWCPGSKYQNVDLHCQDTKCIFGVADVFPFLFLFFIS